MTWAVFFLGWVVASVLLGMLMGILLGIRRTLDEIQEETGMTRVLVEEIHHRPIIPPLPETEHVGTVAMETTPASAIVRGKPDEHKWKRGRIGQEDEP